MRYDIRIASFVCILTRKNVQNYYYSTTKIYGGKPHLFRIIQVTINTKKTLAINTRKHKHYAAI